jgi:FkbM family methyltransferase
MFKKKIIKRMAYAIACIVATVRCQPFWEKMYLLSLYCMNIGAGGNYALSGEKGVLKYIKKKYRNAGQIVVFDVGANVGHYSLMLREILGSKAEIHAFEPSKRTFEKMSENIGGALEIRLYNLGFGDANAEVLLYSDSDASGLASVYKRNLEHFSMEMGNAERIRIETVDDFCLSNQVERIHFLKLDVEGHELKVLEGARNLLKNGLIECIQFEFGGCNIDSRTYFQDFYYLLKDSYDIYRVIKTGLCRINEYKEIYECFVTTNFLAVYNGSRQGI